MHSINPNQQEEAAIDKSNHYIRATTQKIGYPFLSTLYRWNEHRKAGITNWHSIAGSK